MPWLRLGYAEVKIKGSVRRVPWNGRYVSTKTLMYSRAFYLSGFHARIAQTLKKVLET